MIIDLSQIVNEAKEPKSIKAPPAVVGRILMNRGKRIRVPRIGTICAFTYDPKHKATLPWYDTSPVSLVINQYSDGFLGLNFHYLNVSIRTRMLDILKKNYREKSTFAVSWSVVKNASNLSPLSSCIKRYLYSHTTSSLFEVQPKDWGDILIAPIERFVGASAAKVQAATLMNSRK